MTAAAKLTRKHQATIPKEVREVLGLRRGDLVLFEIEDGAVSLRRGTPLDAEFLRSLEGTLSEWLSDHDEEAYGDL